MRLTRKVKSWNLPQLLTRAYDPHSDYMSPHGRNFKINSIDMQLTGIER